MFLIHPESEPTGDWVNTGILRSSENSRRVLLVSHVSSSTYIPAYRKTESKHHLPTRKGKYPWNVKYMAHSQHQGRRISEYKRRSCEGK